MKKIIEDAPTNSAGAGNVAGIGVGPKGEPGGKKNILVTLRRKSIVEEEPEVPSAMKTLYVYRSLRNAGDLVKWAQDQGFTDIIPSHKMHATIAFSKTKVDRNKISPSQSTVIINQGVRTVEQLGDKGAIVLRFVSPEMESDWNRYIESGASWDHNGFKPHITIKFGDCESDLNSIKPYNGILLFGPENVEDVNLKWQAQLNDVN